MDENLLLSEAERDDPISDGGTVLQKEGKLGPERLVVDIPKVTQSSTLEIEALDVVHG